MAYINQAVDSITLALVTWVTTAADFGAAEYPGPGDPIDGSIAVTADSRGAPGAAGPTGAAGVTGAAGPTGSSDGNSLNGTPVTGATGALSYGLFGNGSSMRARKSELHFQDYLDFYGVSGNGTDDCTTALQAFLNAIPSYGRGHIPKPTSFYLVKEPLIMWDGTAYGNSRGKRVYTEHDGASSNSAGTAQIRFDLAEPNGGVGNITAFGNGSGSSAFTADASTDVITYTDSAAPRSYAQVQLTTTGTLPGNLALLTTYWLIRTGSGTAKLATSLANAIAGTARDITDAGTGTHTLTVQAAGQNMTTLSLGTYTGSSPTGTYSGGVACKRVLASEKAKWVGRYVRVHGAATDGNNGEYLITDVPADDTLIYQGGAASSDTNDSLLVWRIGLSCFDIRARDTSIRGLHIAPKASTELTTLCEINSSPGAGALSMFGTRMFSCLFYTDATATCKFRFGVSIARRIVPEPGHNIFSVNGDGLPQNWAVTQVDTITFEDCYVVGAEEGGIEHCSSSAQSRENNWIRGALQGCRAGYLGPTRDHGPTGAGQMNFDETTFSVCDTCFVLNAGSSKPREVKNCYAEGCSRIWVERSGLLSSPAKIVGGAWAFSSTTLHPSGAVVDTASQGRFDFNSRFAGTDSGLHHMVLSSNASAKEQVAIIRPEVSGSVTWTGRRGRVTSTNSGPWRYTGTIPSTPGDAATEYVGLIVDGGTERFVHFTQRNLDFATALTIDLKRVRPWHKAMVVMGRARPQNKQLDIGAVVRANDRRYVVTTPGTTANTADPSGGWTTTLDATVNDGTITFTCTGDVASWGEPEDYRWYLETMTEGTGGSIKVNSNTTPMTCSSSTATGRNQSQISKDTGGLVDIPWSAGTGIDPVGLNVDFDCKHTVALTDAAIAHNKFSKRYGASLALGLGGNSLESIVGLAGLGTTVPCRNFGGKITISGATATGAVTFANTEDDNGYRVSRLAVVDASGTPATLSAKAATLTTGGFTVNLDQAPGVGSSVEVHWGIER